MALAPRGCTKQDEVPEVSVSEEKKGLSATVYVAPREISVKDVARLMTARGVGAVVIVDGLKPIGIVTDRDIVVRVTAPGLDAAMLMVGTVMSSPLVTITANQSVTEAVALMGRHGIRRLPIVDETGRLTTILSLDDILRLNLAGPAELSPIVREQPLPPPVPPERQAASSPEPRRVPAAPAVTLPGTVDPGRTPTGQPVKIAARSSVVVPMVKRRRRRTRIQSIRYWINNNQAWVLIVIGLSLVGTFLALSVDFMGRALYNYQERHYEPKDEARQLYLEQMERARQRNQQQSR